MVYDLIIVGGGAAGFFAGSSLLDQSPGARVLILEKSGKLLSKVKISGGGRCNVTHHCFDNEKLLASYPRGNPWLSDVFDRLGVKQTLNWFRNIGIEIVAEADGRMFPKSNDSSTIADGLLHAFTGKGGKIQLQKKVMSFEHKEGIFEICIENENPLLARHLLIATGGSPDIRGFDFLIHTGHRIVTPVPSLFTFNTRPHPWADLQGLSVTEARVGICNSPYSFSGPVLVTHWGFSGPAVLKLSAFAARYLHEKNYAYQFSIDWLPSIPAGEVLSGLLDFQKNHGRKKPAQTPVFNLPTRLWAKLCTEVKAVEHFNWAETGRKKVEALAEKLKDSRFEGSGKTTYKDEFVTAGGVDTSEVDTSTCESKRIPSLFFAGEVLNADGITGGFNFQAAWSTGFAVAHTISGRLKKMQT